MPVIDFPAEARDLARASLTLVPSSTYRRTDGGRRGPRCRVVYIGPQMRRGVWTGRVVVWNPATKRNGVCLPRHLKPLKEIKREQAIRQK